MTDIVGGADEDCMVVKLDPKRPIELEEMSKSLGALSRLYDSRSSTDGDRTSKLFITKIKSGSVIFELAPLVPLLGSAVSMMGHTVTIADFTYLIAKTIKRFSEEDKSREPGEEMFFDDASAIREFVAPLLGKPGASLEISHAKYERIDGERRVMCEYKFDEPQLNRAVINIDRAISAQKLDELPFPDEAEESDYVKEVMLFMDQAKRGPGKQRGRTGDRGIIPAVSQKALPVYFRKGTINLKSQITREVNPLTSAFVVDVSVQFVGGEPRGYIITNIRQALPGSEDDPELGI